MTEPDPHEPAESLVKRAGQLVNRTLGMVEETKAVQRAIPSTIKQAFSALSLGTAAEHPSEAAPPAFTSDVCPHPSALASLRRFMRNDEAEFTCPEQAQALDAVLAGTQHVLLIGPTGMGKSSVFLIPAKESPRQVTIVLVPLSALRIDFSRRCSKLGIACSEWTEGSPRETTIVMVSPENAKKGAFLGWATNLRLRRRLLLFVVDELHFFRTHRDFRECFSLHRNLVQSSEYSSPLAPYSRSAHALTKEVPFLLMTATCPPELEGELLEQLSVQNCVVIRAATPRPEISYNVHVLDSKVSAENCLVESVEEARASYGTGEKGLVFCRSHETTEHLASLLGCPSYHRDERTVDELRNIYDEFTGGDGQNVMVSTSLLGAGVDIPHVRHVWHFGVPWSLIDYIQETGRGGRDGRPAHSHVFTWKAELQSSPRKLQYTEDAMRQLLTQPSDCRRVLISQILDNRPTSCTLLKRSNFCDHCRTDAEHCRPQSPIKFFQVPASVASAKALPPVQDQQVVNPRPPSASDPEPASSPSDPGPSALTLDTGSSSHHTSDPGPSSRQLPPSAHQTPDPPSAPHHAPPVWSRQAPDHVPAAPAQSTPPYSGHRPPGRRAPSPQIPQMTEFFESLLPRKGPSQVRTAATA